MAANNKSGIYSIYNKVNGLFYVGAAINFRKRWELHRLELKNNRHHSRHLQNAYNKYGLENFEFKILQIVEDKNRLTEIEQYWLNWTKCYDPKIGYNICKNAESRLGIKSTKEHIEKIVAANKGKKRTEEQKQRLRELRLGTKLTEEQKQARRDYRHTEEAKLKIASRKGWKHSEEAKRKMSDARWNRKSTLINIGLSQW